MEEINEETTNTKTMKIITIDEPTKQKKTATKNVNTQKEKKLRVETKTWGLEDSDLLHTKQLTYIQHLNEYKKDAYVSKIITHIKSKICGYKQQDIIKKKFDANLFVSFEHVIDLLVSCKMNCCYCSDFVYVLYEKVRETKQWSLDRIDNNIGHNVGNLVIACLECNLKRRRTNKDAFMFTKNMVIVREDYIPSIN